MELEVEGALWGENGSWLGGELCSGSRGREEAALVRGSNLVAIPLIALLGLSCNAVNMAVLWTGGRRLASSSFLLALSVADSLFLLFGTLEVTPPHITSLATQPSFNRLYMSAVLYIRFAAATAYKTSVLLVLAFNVERYVAVCHPLRYPRLASQRLNRTVIGASVGLSGLLSVQWPLAYERSPCTDVWTGQTFHRIRLRKGPEWAAYYRHLDYASMVLFNLLPMGVLVVLNTGIVRTLRRVVRSDAARWREAGLEEGAAGRKGRKGSLGSVGSAWSANAVLFAVVGLFVVCLGPQVPARVLFELHGAHSRVVLAYMSISQQLLFLNASLNFALYCLVSRRYRQVMKAALKRLLTAWPASPASWSGPPSPPGQPSPQPQPPEDQHLLPTLTTTQTL